MEAFDINSYRTMQKLLGVSHICFKAMKNVLMCERSGDVFRGQEEWSRGQAQDPEHILLLHGTGNVQAPHRSERAYPHTYLTSNNSQLKLEESKTDEVRDRIQRFPRPFAPSVCTSLFLHTCLHSNGQPKQIARDPTGI